MFFYILQYFLKFFFKSVTEFQSVSIISCTPIFLISHVIDFKKSFKLLWGQQKNEKISEFEYDTLDDMSNLTIFVI